MAQALHGRLEPDGAAAGEDAVKVMVEGLEIRLVDGDEPARRLAGEILRQTAQEILKRMADESEEVFDRFRVQPGIQPEPRRIDEVMESDDRLKAMRPAIGDALCVAVERALVERRRRSGRGQTFLGAKLGDRLTRDHSMLMRKRVHAHVAATLEILVGLRPEIGGAAGGDDVAGVFRPSPSCSAAHRDRCSRLRPGSPRWRRPRKTSCGAIFGPLLRTPSPVTSGSWPFFDRRKAVGCDRSKPWPLAYAALCRGPSPH